jgi:hypothetical protein
VALGFLVEAPDLEVLELVDLVGRKILMDQTLQQQTQVAVVVAQEAQRVQP